MAYSVYQTDCVILGVRDIQEHDLMLRVFSPIFGYMRVIAKGTRKHTSKLRANIQTYSITTISVVKGKEFFILTDISVTFSFIQSKTVVTFLTHIEHMFYDDENDHGEKINADIYSMTLFMCKLLVWMVAEKKDSDDIDLVYKFFIVYVKGLQGFVEKIEIPPQCMDSVLDMCTYIKDTKEYVVELYTKIN